MPILNAQAFDFTYNFSCADLIEKVKPSLRAPGGKASFPNTAKADKE
jgi:hypothetical protein